MYFDLKKIAKNLVNKSLRIEKGQKVIISCGDMEYFDFAQKIAIAIIENQAYPHLKVSSDEIALARMKQSESYLKHTPPPTMERFKTADVLLSLAFPRNPALFQNLDQNKVAASSEGSRQVFNIIKERNRNRVNLKTASLLLPTRESAEFSNIDFDEYSELIYNALDVDYDKLYEEARSLAEKIEGRKDIHIVSPGGTDIKFSIENRQVFIDDGVYSEEDVENGIYMCNLPAGEICVAPVENSANGIAVFEYNQMFGHELENLKFTFENGKVISIEADRGEEFLKGLLKKHTGEKYGIAELGIGLNPGVNRITGNLALDEKIKGTLHLAIGDNRVFGQQQESSIHQDFVMQSPTLYADSEKIIENGIRI